ncbi:MAG: hypothetical protein DRH30_12440 [Deltaproteobacteria bacterium]|nr:MAG: hypothetical protein DRH30_12440 [Deltaproteobacteria bacterium]
MPSKVVMRYLVGFVFALALVASPLSVSAQDGEEEGGSHVEGRHPEAFVVTAYDPPSTSAGEAQTLWFWHGSTPSIGLEEIETRVKRAKIGLGVSVVVMVGGSVLFLYGAAADDTAASATGLILSLGGTGGTIASGILLRRRKRDRDSLWQAHYGRPHRVQWDLARSRLVF